MKKIVAISAGRKNKISDKAIQVVLNNLDFKNKFYSLSDFELLTCDACNRCVSDNLCIKDDMLNKIFKDMIDSDAIIFAGPEYWDGANAKTRAFWERICFSGRHNSYFPLEDKPGVILGISGTGKSEFVIKDISRFMQDAKIDIIKKLAIQGEYACFTCGYGEDCKVGGVYELYPHEPKINKCKIPSLNNQHPQDSQAGNNIKKELIEVADYINNLLKS